MRITVNDIAKAAKVSQSTVSKVLNNYPKVKESTRLKVLNAIEELNFTPDPIARSMITKKTKTLGLIVGDISNPYFAESAKVIIEKAKTLGYDVIISNTNHNDLDLDTAIQTLLNKRVDGLLIASASLYCTKVNDLFAANFPVVLFINLVEGDDVNYVVLNNRKGAELAVDHLVESGHQKIAFVSGSFKYSTLNQRFSGFQAALQKHHLPLYQENVYNEEFINEEFLYEKIYRFVDRTLSATNAPTAFFTTSDQMAFAVLDAAAKKNIRIPEDISVVGFDNMNLSSNETIALTTVSQQKERMATLALEKLVMLIEKGDTVSKPIQLTLEPELIIRRTTGRMKVRSYEGSTQ
ncbi:LacI family DNA-binding transcriptional regulator [Pseudalkalibacillus decolorationis]|uniref:LacI family DNA-binding transcriptional regulator n=1 Tax=Pseudalkalibacillus decolorationis TaxID=163879 RepID=UPI00214917D9|nr:LacI family DNA-binding transcriptional regulator [Pseudalkalibacillus decolorationis]